MSSTKHGGTRLLMVAVTVAGLVTACTDDDTPPTGIGSTSPAAGTSPAAPYEGPELPGLAGQPAWSMAGDHTDWKIYALGDVVALIHRPGPGSTTSSAAPKTLSTAPAKASSGTPDVIEFRDVRSGEIRKSVDTPVKEAWQGNYKGEPALYVYYQIVTPSDGLSAERRVDVREVYDETGSKVMSISKPAGDEKFAIVDGWVVSSKQGDPALTISDAQGAARHRVDCGGRQLCALETQNVVLGSTKLPAVVGDLAFQAQPIADSSGINASRIVATNLTTGQQAWSTSTMDKPAGTAAEAKVTGAHAIPIKMINGKLLVAWYMERSDRFGERGEILALHDPVTGKLLVTGPELGNGHGPMVIDGKAEIAVVVNGTQDGHALAWELTTGRTLWRQEENERELHPNLIAGDVLYGLTNVAATSSTRNLIAVDVKTKAVRKDSIKDTPTPVAAGTGHVAVSDLKGLFVFPIAS